MLPNLVKKPEFKKFSILMVFAFSLTMLLSLTNRNSSEGDVLASTFTITKCKNQSLKLPGRSYAVEGGKPCYFDYKATLTRSTILNEIATLTNDARKFSKPNPVPGFSKPAPGRAYYYSYDDPTDKKTGCIGLVINGAQNTGNKRYGNAQIGFATYVIYDGVSVIDKNGKQVDTGAFLVQSSGPQLESSDGAGTCKGTLKFKAGTSGQIPSKLKFNDKGYVAPKPSVTPTRPKPTLTPTRPTPTKPRATVTPAKPTPTRTGATVTPAKPTPAKPTPTRTGTTVTPAKPTPTTPGTTVVKTNPQPTAPAGPTAPNGYICGSTQFTIAYEIAKFLGRTLPTCEEEVTETDPYDGSSNNGEDEQSQQNSGNTEYSYGDETGNYSQESASAGSQDTSYQSTDQSVGVGYDSSSYTDSLQDTGNQGFAPQQDVSLDTPLPSEEVVSVESGQVECVQPNFFVATFNTLRSAVTGEAYDPCAPSEQQESSDSSNIEGPQVTPLGSEVDCNSLVERIRRVFGQVSPACQNIE